MRDIFYLLLLVTFIYYYLFRPIIMSHALYSFSADELCFAHNPGVLHILACFEKFEYILRFFQHFTASIHARILENSEKIVPIS